MPNVCFAALRAARGVHCKWPVVYNMGSMEWVDAKTFDFDTRHLQLVASKLAH